MTLSTTLQDVSVYVLAHWVLGFLDEHRAIARCVHCVDGRDAVG